MKRVLIAGCNGFVGKYLIDAFRENNYTVVGLDHVDADIADMEKLERYYRVSLTEAKALREVIAETRPDFIVNLAGISSVKASWNIPAETMEVNAVGTINLLEAVKWVKYSPRILLVGSSEEYQAAETRISESFPIEANNPYGISKVTQEYFAELYREKFGMDIICTRTFGHTGIGQKDIFVIPDFIKQTAEIECFGLRPQIRVGNVEVYRDIGDVRDMVSAYRMILESNTKHWLFNVGSGVTHKLKDVLEFIISLATETIEIVVDKEKLRPSDNQIVWCDNSRLMQETGWRKRYDLYDTIREMYQYYMDQFRKKAE